MIKTTHQQRVGKDFLRTQEAIMPYISVKLAKGRTAEQKQKFAEAVTQAATAILNVEADWVTVLFDEYERENWATGGTLHSIKFGTGCGRETEK